MESKDVFQIVPFTPADGFALVKATESEFSLPTTERWKGLFEAAEKESVACTITEKSVPIACLGVYVKSGAVWFINNIVRRGNLFAAAVHTFLLVTAEANGLAKLQTPVGSKVKKAFFERVGFKTVGPLPDEQDLILMEMEVTNLYT
ncbi:MAG: hypothetical protein ABSC19_15825 [Syntrophorhabdales bacterium]|jgi:hypothetical protein